MLEIYHLESWIQSFF